LNTANLQLEGMVMALASLCETLADRGVLEHKEIGAALSSRTTPISYPRPIRPPSCFRSTS
jgi:hypothetical protein